MSVERKLVTTEAVAESWRQLGKGTQVVVRWKALTAERHGTVVNEQKVQWENLEFWVKEGFLGFLIEIRGEELFTGAEMAQRHLHHLSPPRHERQLTKVVKTEHTAQAAGSSTIGRSVPFPVAKALGSIPGIC